MKNKGESYMLRMKYFSHSTKSYIMGSEEVNKINLKCLTI